MTVNSRVINVFLGWSPDAVDVPLMNGLRVQMLPTIEDLPRARKHQFAAFVASEALLAVWDDDALHLIERAKAIDSELMELVWTTGGPKDLEQVTAKAGPIVAAVEIDEESGEVLPQNRPTKLLNTVLFSFTIILIILVLGSGCKSMVVEVAVDHNHLQFLFLFLTPIQIFFTLVGYQFRGNSASSLTAFPQFFAQVIVGCLAQCFGPVRQMTQNLRFFSAHCSPILPFNALFTRRAYTPLLFSQSGLSNGPFQLTNFRMGRQTCSLMTTDCKLSVKKSERNVSSFTPIIALDGQPVPNMAPMVLIEGENPKRYAPLSPLLSTPYLPFDNWCIPEDNTVRSFTSPNLPESFIIYLLSAWSHSSNRLVWGQASNMKGEWQHPNWRLHSLR